MSRGTYYITSETSEDRFGESESLEAALKIARGVVREGPVGEPVSIEHDGKVIRQFVRTADGEVKEASAC